MFEKKGVNIFALGSLLASLNPRLTSLQTLRPFKTHGSVLKYLRRERSRHILLSRCFTEGVRRRVLHVVNKPVLSIFY